MHLRVLLIASAIGMLSVANSASGAVAVSPGIPVPIAEAAKLFGARPSGYGPDLSPLGDKLVYLAAGQGAVTVAHVRDLKSQQDKALVQSSGKPEQLSWCAFADEQWVVCRFGGEVKQDGMIFTVSRNVAIDTHSGTIRSLGVVEHSAEASGFEQFDGTIVDWLPEEKGALLMQRRYAGDNGNPERIGVDHIQIDPFIVHPVEPPIARDLDYMTDGHGTVRIRSEEQSTTDQLFTGKTTYEYRMAGSTQWLRLPEGGPDFTPLVVEKQSNSLYFLKPLDGRDALYRLRLDGSNAETLVASNPNVDIDGIIRFGPGDPVVGYRYVDDRSRSVYFDSGAKALGEALSKALPDMPLINIVSRSRDGDKLIIHAGSDVDPGVYFLLDQAHQRMDPLLNSSDLIDGAGLAPMKSVSVPTADGKSIPAYVTMRTDLGAGPHPAVVMPHGGPEARDTWEFDWLAQFLAARGYVVIQPNFRGSAGYGKDFVGENAFHEWRQVMSDIKDSADWIQKQGLADPKRMAILGWSYGGYAALQSAAMDSRYRAVVAIAPVTDLKRLRWDAHGFREQTLSDKEIGKGDLLADGSPINRASDIHAPVLLVHGTLDGNVSYEHSKHMLAELKHAGDDADLLTFEGLDHQLADSDARVQMLTRIGELLDRTIGR